MIEYLTPENILDFFPELHESRIITVVGGGGKTTFLNTLAKGFAGGNEKVLLTTTTHILRPSFLEKNALVEQEDYDKLHAAVSWNTLTALGIPCQITGGQVKWRAPSRSFQEKIAENLCQKNPCAKEERPSAEFPDKESHPSFGFPVKKIKILCEGDGAKRLPVKLPRDGEPVFFPETDTVIGVIGLSCLGRPINETLFRHELLPQAFPALAGKRNVDTELLYQLALSPLGLKKGVRSERFSVILNQADILSEEQRTEVQRLAEKIRDNGISCHVVSFL